MDFPFDAEKLVETAAYLMQREGGKMEVLKLTKLLYLTERESFKRRGFPIFGGQYYSLPHGPIVSEGLNLMNGNGLTSDQVRWNEVISPRYNANWMSLLADFKQSSLNRREIALLDEIYNQFGGLTASQLRRWCHTHLPEYVEVTTGREPITLKEIALAIDGCPASIAEEAETQRFLKHVFSS